MWRILQQDSPKDWVLATGEQHSVREFLEVAYSHIGIQIVWRGEGVDEKGYDGQEVGFVHLPTGLEFYVYSRWDAVRVGCRQDERTDAVSLSEELSRYLRQAATN